MIKKLLGVSAVLLIALVLIGIGGWWYADHMLTRLGYERDPDANRTIEKEDFWQEDVFNVLLLGTDERTEDYDDFARSDCTMILSLDKGSHTIRLVSLQRGIGVPIEGREDDWLTHVFAYGGAEAMVKTVREQFDIPIDRYIRVNFSAFEQIIDALGGVDIELTEAEVLGLNGKVYTNAVTRAEVHEGLNHLDGYDALQYARQRFIDSDWQRIVRQRNVMKAAYEQLKKLGVSQWNEFLSTALPLVRTNFTKEEIASLLPYAAGFANSEIEQMSLPAENTYGSVKTSDGRSLMDLDWEENQAILKEFLYQ